MSNGLPKNLEKNVNGNTRFLSKKEKPKDLMGTLIRLWNLFGEEKAKIKLVFIVVLIGALITLTIPYLIGRSIDVLEGGAPIKMNAFYIILTVVFIAYISEGVLNFTQEFLMAKISQKIVKNIRKVFFDKLQKLSVAYYDNHSSGDIMSRVTNDIDNISITISTSIPTLMNSAIIIVGAFIIMISLSMILTIAALISIPLIFILTKSISKRTRGYFKQQQAALGKLNGCIEEGISGIEIIKAFNREDAIKENFEKYNEEYRKAGFKAQLWSGILMPLMNVINNLSFALVATVGGMLVIDNHLTVGVIASFLSYSRQFVRPLNQIANIFNSLQSAIAGAERVFEVLDEDEELKDKSEVQVLQNIKGNIEFIDVEFGYNEDRKVLDGVSFSAKSGESIAIVGHTGSGKTTIMNLLTRFYEINKGNIKIDGTDIREYTRESLRNAFSLVLQDTYLFSGTIFENIVYGKEEVEKEEVIKACKIANAHYFIKRLSKGYETVISDGGGSLSAGQKQLIAIARAVLANKPILILDEATSNVDTRTELKIQDGMLRLMSGRTTFIIAHRLSTIKDADKILVINKGKIVESGTHKALIEKKGYYYGLYSI